MLAIEGSEGIRNKEAGEAESCGQNVGCSRSAGGRHLPSVKSKAKAIVDMTLDDNNSKKCAFPPKK